MFTPRPGAASSSPEMRGVTSTLVRTDRKSGEDLTVRQYFCLKRFTYSVQR